MEPELSPGGGIKSGQESFPLGSIQSETLSTRQGFACTGSRHHGAASLSGTSTAAAARHEEQGVDTMPRVSKPFAFTSSSTAPMP
jgi:hypothetical protein